MSARLPDSVRYLIDTLADLPSIGPRQATRLAFHLISQGLGTIDALARSLDNLAKIKICERCFFIHDNAGKRCGICENAQRDARSIMLLEKETDLLSVENTGKWNGRYFILGAIAKTGVLEEWQKLRLQSFKNMITKEHAGQVDEIILALNPTSVGDWNASILTKELGPFAKKISRLGRGLPTGGEIEFADDETLGGALERRS